MIFRVQVLIYQRVFLFDSFWGSPTKFGGKPTRNEATNQISADERWSLTGSL
jgi:hypothetical protein